MQRNPQPKTPEPISPPIPPVVSSPADPGSTFDSMDGAYSVKDWHNNAIWRAQLLAVLQSPILRMAFKTLYMAFLPSGPLQIDASATSDSIRDSLAFRYVNRAGFYGFPKALFSLANDKVVTPSNSSDLGELVDDSDPVSHPHK